MKSPIEHLKTQLKYAEDDKAVTEAELADLDKRRESLLASFQEFGLSVIELKAAIKVLESI